MSGPKLPNLAATLVAAGAAAQTPGDGSLLLDPLVVTAPATPAAGEGAGWRTTVESGELLGAWQGAGIATVLNGIPGVTTETSAGDPAIAVNIRGLQGQGRVVVSIDGAPQNFARSDHGANGTFYADPEMLRSMEVVRGPASADAAPGAIGGTLALRTVEAADLIDPDAVQGGEARLRYGDLTADPTLHLAYVRRFGASASALLAFTRAEASDYEAPDGTRVDAAETTRSGLGKIAFSPALGQTVTLSYSALDYDFGSAGLTLFRTESHVAQQSLAEGLRPAGPWRSYDTATDGLRASATRDLALGPTAHAFTVVAEGFRDRVTTDDPNAAGGSLTPSGERRIGSVLAEDEISLGARSQAILGLRYLGYRLESPDGGVSGSDLSPSLTLQRQVWGGASVYGTLAQAYRPPTLSESLVSGQHPKPADFYIRPNPDLKPERALTAEIGATLALADLVLAGDTLDARIAVYRNDVDDYIGLVQRGTFFDSYFQYDNIDAVRIEGAELEVGYDAQIAFASVSGQLMEGEDRETDEPVSGVPPNRLVLTAGLRNPSQTLEVGGRVNIVGSRADGALSSQAWTTVDLFLTRQIGARGSFGLALNNVTDETYTPYLNTQPSPGFNALASLSIAF